MTRTQRQIEEHRKSEARVRVLDAAGRPLPGVPVWVEQETHAFPFGYVAPDLEGLPAPDRQRCTDRLNEVFNRVSSGGLPCVPGATRVAAPDGVRLGRFRSELDRLASAGRPLELHVLGQCVGLRPGNAGTDERAAAEQAAALYTLCFAHPAVHAIVWNGVWDGEEYVCDSGLLRRDFAPKRALRTLHKLIGTVWHTRAAGETGQDGRFGFRGFAGDYRAAARAGDAPATTCLFTCRRGAEASLILP